VQHERIGVPAQFGHDEWHALRHQAGHEGHVSREPIQLRHQDTAFNRPGRGEGGGELRPPVNRVGTLAGFRLDELRMMVRPSASAKRATVARCASIPRP